MTTHTRDRQVSLDDFGGAVADGLLSGEFQDTINIKRETWPERGQTVTVDEVVTYEDAGMMTADDGLVVSLSNGQRFLLTIREGVSA